MNITKWRMRLRKYGGWVLPFICILLLGRSLGQRRRTALTAASVLLLAMLFGVGSHRQARELQITFLDVGKGDAAVLELPSGQVVVVDTGTADRADKVVVPFLKKRGIRRIDTLLLSHPHNDHIGGAISLLRQFPVGVLLENGAEDKQMQKVREAAESRRVPVRCLRRNDTLDFGANLTARILSPESSTQFRRANDNSLVLRVQYRKVAVLFMADAQADAEKEILRTGQTVACDVLKVGHHGNKHSSIPAFLNAARPRYAVISVDASNQQGCPHPETLERFAKIKAQVFRTDQNGNCTCRTDGQSLTMTPERP